jgi:GrpB-like predicted nucleotidyltransferase (UPF0157 family)
LRIDHHGSTAIPGFGAKPVIDIQVSVAALQRFRRTVQSSKPLAALTYRIQTIRFDRSIGRARGRTVFTSTSLKAGDARNDERWHLATISGTIHDVAREYEDLKRTIVAHIVAADPDSQERYAMAKTDFIDRVVGVAASRDIPKTGQVNESAQYANEADAPDRLCHYVGEARDSFATLGGQRGERPREAGIKGEPVPAYPAIRA